METPKFEKKPNIEEEKKPFKKGTIEEILEKGKGKWEEVKNYLKIGTLVTLLNVFSGGVEAQTLEQIENFKDTMEQLRKKALESEKDLTEKMKINGEKVSAGEDYTWTTPNGIELQTFGDGYFSYKNFKDSVFAADTDGDGNVDVIVTGDVENYTYYKKYTFYEKTDDRPESVVLNEKEKGDINEQGSYYSLKDDEAKKLTLQVQNSYTNRLNDVVENVKKTGKFGGLPSRF